MKKIILSIVSSFTFIALVNAATVTWDGGASSTDWMDPLNWDTDAIPTTTDDVVIDGFTVSLDASTTVQRVLIIGSGELTIGSAATLNISGFTGNDDGFEINNSATVINNGAIIVSSILGGTAADGIYVRGTFNNNGAINIDGIAQHGLYVARGNFTNSTSGTITVTNTGQVNGDGDAIYIDDSSGVLGLMTNNGSVTVNATTGDDAMYVNDGASFVNNNLVTLTGTVTSDNGIRVDDAGIFNNNAGATFSIDGFGDDQLFTDNTGIFNNSGTVNLTNCGDVGLYITDASTFTNMSGGNVNITNASNFGAQIDAESLTAELINSGTITITGGSNDGFRLQESGLMTNTSSGVLDIVSAGDEGIIFEGASTINNSGVIDITNATDHAVELKSGGTLTNSAGASFNVTTPGDKGVLMVTGATINNSGLIEIDGSVKEGIDMVGGIFNNNAGAEYKARNIGDDGLEINTATFNNDGYINIDGSGSEDIETFTGAVVNNTTNATYTPGSSPGDLEIKGDFDFGEATITFEIDGTSPTTEYDQIVTSSTGNMVTITNAKAFLDFGAYTPTVGDMFEVVSGSPNLVGMFASVASSEPSVVTTSSNNGSDLEISITAVLPVELASFSANATEKGTQLSWITMSEVNNDGFEVERSRTASDWKSIGFVQGRGESRTSVEYSFVDQTLLDGTTYYRLKQIDLDGAVEYSKTISVQPKKRNANVLTYPNPVVNELKIISDSSNDNVELKLFDSNGQLIWFNNGMVQQIPFDSYSKGVYFLEFFDVDGRVIHKIVK